MPRVRSAQKIAFCEAHPGLRLLSTQRLDQLIHPVHASARQAVSAEVRRGNLPKAKTLRCVRCGGPASHYHHYDGYEPQCRYRVEPLCSTCHKAVHASEQEEISIERAAWRDQIEVRYSAASMGLQTVRMRGKQIWDELDPRCQKIHTRHSDYCSDACKMWAHRHGER